MFEAGGECEWTEALVRVCAGRERATIERALQTHGVPCRRVVRPRDLVGDTILSSCGFIAWPWREDLGSYPSYAAFWMANGGRPAITHGPPRLEDDNEYVLSAILGKSAQEIEALERKGVIADRPNTGRKWGSGRPVERRQCPRKTGVMS
jgi:crotonobetainyl-CoA:carnitine CoA-transferase CaiB-like acyl-CoA transferase